MDMSLAIDRYGIYILAFSVIMFLSLEIAAIFNKRFHRSLDVRSFCEFIGYNLIFILVSLVVPLALAYIILLAVFYPMWIYIPAIIAALIGLKYFIYIKYFKPRQSRRSNRNAQRATRRR